jgi:hypothetical protein
LLLDAVLKVAVTDCEPLIVTIQVPVPEQGPDQPAKVEPESAVAVRVICVPLINHPAIPAQLPLQLMPPGFDVTVPFPVPLFPTERV